MGDDPINHQFRKLFSSRMIEIMYQMAQCRDVQKRKISKVIEQWNRKKIFDQALCEEMASIISTSCYEFEEMSDTTAAPSFGRSSANNGVDHSRSSAVFDEEYMNASDRDRDTNQNSDSGAPSMNEDTNETDRIEYTVVNHYQRSRAKTQNPGIVLCLKDIRSRCDLSGSEDKRCHHL